MAVILGIMSDTHGNVRLMHQVAEIMRDEYGAATIFHAGDNFDDAEELLWSGYDVRMVPGLSCDEYVNQTAPRTIVETFDGVDVACAHADHDLKARERAASIVINGHTHVAQLMKLGRSLYLNPGHLKAPVDRGERPSFGIVEIDEPEVRATILETDGRIRLEERIPRNELE